MDSNYTYPTVNTADETSVTSSSNTTSQANDAINITQVLSRSTNENVAATTISSATSEVMARALELDFEVFLPIIFGLFMIVTLSLVVFYVKDEERLEKVATNTDEVANEKRVMTA